MKLTALSALAIGVCAILSGCRSAGGPRADAGACTIGQPGEPARAGHAAFTRTVLDPDTSALGSLAITLSCVVPDTRTGDELIVVFPWVDRELRPGSYRIVDPARPEPLAPADQARAFAVVRRTPAAPLTFVARQGVVRLTATTAGRIDGAFQLALTPEADQRGARLVVGGGFSARPFLP